MLLRVAQGLTEGSPVLGECLLYAGPCARGHGADVLHGIGVPGDTLRVGCSRRVHWVQNPGLGARGRRRRVWSGPGSGRLACVVSLTPKPRALLGLLHVSPVGIRGRPCCLNFTAEDSQEHVQGHSAGLCARFR